jgi:hypothetical protein
MKFHSHCWAIFFSTTLLVASGVAQAADLLETFHAAQANDPLFAAARATQQAGQEKLSQGPQSISAQTAHLTMSLPSIVRQCRLYLRTALDVTTAMDMV